MPHRPAASVDGDHHLLGASADILVEGVPGLAKTLAIKSLADSLEMERTTLTRNLRPLEEQGYVAIAPEGRHRSRVLTLTVRADIVDGA